MKVQWVVIVLLTLVVGCGCMTTKSEAVKVGSEIAFDVTLDQVKDLRGTASPSPTIRSGSISSVLSEMEKSLLVKNGGETPLFLITNSEPGKVEIANVITKGQTVNGAGAAAVKSDFYGESQLVQNYPNPFNEWDGLDENGRSVASGIYFYRISAGDFQSVNRMLMLK